MTGADPNVVRAVIERHLGDLEADVRRIDGDHATINARLVDLEAAVRVGNATVTELNMHLRTLIAEPPRLDGHWRHGSGIILAQWSDAAARKVGNYVLTVVFAAFIVGAFTWAILRGGK